FCKVRISSAAPPNLSRRGGSLEDLYLHVFDQGTLKICNEAFRQIEQCKRFAPIFWLATSSVEITVAMMLSTKSTRQKFAINL
ncbi:MAG: hypothetical protein ABI705_08360, partial [Aestuariivirga sp.]